MCIKYQCAHCKEGKTETCELWTEIDKCNNVVREYPWGHKKLWCRTCSRVLGAINALNALVFREPWLLTEGMAGAPVLEDWEREGLEEPVVAVDSGSDGFTKKQREEVRREAEAAFNARFEALKVAEAEEKEKEGEEEEEEEKEKEAK